VEKDLEQAVGEKNRGCSSCRVFLDTCRVVVRLRITPSQTHRMIPQSYNSTMFECRQSEYEYSSKCSG
jgi:hypothetical protein